MSNKQEIDPKLEALLDELRDVPARDPRRAAQGRAQFLSQAVSVRTQAVSRNPIRRLNRWFDKLKQPKEKKTMTTFATILAILALMAGGGAGTVYAAQDSLPNDTLYPVKLYTEEFRMNMAGDSAAEFALMMQFAQRRGDEIEALIVEGEEPTAENMLQFAQQTQQAMQLAGELDGAAQLQVQNMMQNQLQQMLNLQECESEECTMLMEQTRVTLQNQLMLMGAGQGQGQGQVTDEPEEVLPEGETAPESEEQGQEQGQAQGQEQSQGQGSSDGSGQDAMTPAGSENGQGQQNNNQGVDPCIAYYEALAKAQGQNQSQGKGQGGGNSSSGQSLPAPVYGLDGQLCPVP